ncbi:MAG: polysaccharide biosynthesis C-terminal domain-containing protein [Lachnospiraceae bacterium]|nr:polysaccharide biosynthesis C-terminal domain-containing protein [Lachnospiraceae bacterium]
MKIPERKRGSASFKKDSYTIVLLITCIAAMVFRIPLSYIIGDKGMAYFGTAYELYLLLAGVIGYGLAEAAAILVRYRMKRDQVRSAQKVISRALMLGFGVGIVISILTGLLAHVLAEKLFSVPLSGMAVRMISPAIVLYILTGILRGYFQGNGSKIPAMHSLILNTVFLFVGGLAGAVMMHGYGEKVSALLQNEDYAAAYGALGAVVGVLIASILCFLHMLILYFLLKGRLKSQMGRELSRNQDTSLQVVQMLLGTGAIYGVFYLIFDSQVLLDEVLLYRLSGIAEGLDTLWGIYYGRYQVIIGIILGIIVLFCLLPVKRIAVLAEHNEYRSAKERLGILIHQCALLGMPAAILLAVLSENLLNAMYKGNNQQVASWIQLGSVGMLFAVFGIVFMDILLKLKKIKAVLVTAALSLLIHIVTVIILLSGAKSGMQAVVAGNVLFWASMAVAGFILVSRILQYRQEWIRSVAFPVVAAAVAGLIAMLLNKALLSLLGNTASLIVCLIVAVVLYVVLLIALKDFTEEELEILPGGNLILALARMLRLM